MSNTILVKGRGIRKEGVAAEIVNPGHFVTLDATGKVIKQATAASHSPAAVAVENELFGSGITVSYAANDQVVYEVMPPGAEVLARLAPTAAAVVIGDLLKFAADGTVEKFVAISDSPGSVCAMALEAVDNSAGGTEVFLTVEIM